MCKTCRAHSSSKHLSEIKTTTCHLGKISQIKAICVQIDPLCPDLQLVILFIDGCDIFSKYNIKEVFKEKCFRHCKRGQVKGQHKIISKHSVMADCGVEDVKYGGDSGLL